MLNNILNILKKTKKINIMRGYGLGFVIIYILLLILSESGSAPKFLEYVTGPFIGIYILIGIYIGFKYDIPMFHINKIWWWHDKEIEGDFISLIMSIIMFFVALFFIFQVNP